MNLKIIDLGVSNINSIEKCVNFLGFKTEIVNRPNQLENADKIIFPGVGSFNQVIKIIREHKWDLALNQKILKEKISILGICLGMQLLCKESSEHQINIGLNFLNYKIDNLSKFINKRIYKIPHIGWNSIELKKKSLLLDGVKNDADFYFDHSYGIVNFDKNVNCITNHQINFASVISCDNVYGVQFHPEKSLDDGKIILNNFITKI